MSLRLNAYLARATGCSRRQADELIAAGRVTINGRPASVGAQVDEPADVVALDGRPAQASATFTYVALHKPTGYLATRSDPQGRPTVYDLLPAELRQLKPVGRLDADSEGLLLLTDDGAWAQRLLHPRYEHEREYVVELDRPVTTALRRAFERGVKLEEGIARADSVQVAGAGKLRVVLHQGWNRQLRRMAAACGFGVVRLVRVRVSSLRLGNLRPGSWRKIQPREALGLDAVR